MSRRILYVSVSFAVLMLVIGVVMFNRNFSTHGANPRLHKKDLSQRGVVAITSEDTSYDAEVADWLKDRRQEFDRVAGTLKPFSVFVKNTREKDIIAYKLNWELKMTDGTVINYPRIYFAPTYLMGVQHSELYDREMQSIRRGSKRLFTMVPTPFETNPQRQDANSSGMGSFRIGKNDNVDELRNIASTGDISPIISMLVNRMNQATDITVSVESVLFEDGAFVGPPNDLEFSKLRASITAKYDVLSSMKASVAKGEPAGKILDEISAIADRQFPTSGLPSTFEEYYAYFRKLQAEEVKRSRTALSADAKTLGMFEHMLDRKWTIPFEESTEENK